MPTKARSPLALCYHGVSDVSPRRDRYLLFVSPDHLRRQIELLIRWGYRFVTFGELARQAAAGDAGGLVALTFDDGLVDNLSVLVPLLQSMRVPATVFVVSGWLGERHPDAPWTRTLSAPELRAVSATGVEIGGHSTRHDDLAMLPRERAEADMRECRIALETVLDRPVDVFAYPFGTATEETFAACASAGYTAACRSGGRGSWSEPLNLPRQSMANGSSRIGLWLKRDARYEPLVQTLPGRAARRTVRLARRVRS